jgi:broad specificity phosphatase PhoE
MTEGATMRLFLVRHGESVANAGQIYQGWYDSPLNHLGEQQALATARAIALRPNLRAVAVYASPLSRAWRTGMAIGDALGLTPIPHPGLREINVGAASGLTFTAVNARWPDLGARRQALGLDHGWPEGETGREFFARVGATLDEIIAAHRDDDGSPEAAVVLASHGGTIRFALAHLRGETVDWPGDHIDNCSISEALIAPDGRRLVEINCITHLHENGG